jgi:hypothetical protein
MEAFPLSIHASNSASYILPPLFAIYYYYYYYYYYWSRDSVVGIATSYWLDDRGVVVRVPVGSRIFSSQRRPDRL